MRRPNFYPGQANRRRSRAKWGKAARKARRAERDRLFGLRGQSDDRGGRRAFWRRFRRHEDLPQRQARRSARRRGEWTARQERKRRVRTRS